MVQFRLRSLFSLVVVTAIVIAFWTHPSILTFVALVFGICLLLAINFPRYRQHPVLIGAAVGVVVASIIAFGAVASIVIEAEVVQGQLYDEDGPAAFFFVAGIFWFLSSAASAWLGMLVGVVIEVGFQLMTRLQERRAKLTSEP